MLLRGMIRVMLLLLRWGHGRKLLSGEVGYPCHFLCELHVFFVLFESSMDMDMDMDMDVDMDI